MVGVALIAAALGGMIGSGVIGALGFDPGLLTAIVVIVSALVAVGLTLIFNLQKWIIIVYTAIAGAALIVLSGMLLFGQVTMAQLQGAGGILAPIFRGSWLWGLLWLALVVAGVVVQIRTSRGYEFTKDMHVESWG
jgi:hypothetical protein